MLQILKGRSDNDELLMQTNQGLNENDELLVKKVKGQRSQGQSENDKILRKNGKVKEKMTTYWVKIASSLRK